MKKQKRALNNHIREDIFNHCVLKSGFKAKRDKAWREFHKYIADCYCEWATHYNRKLEALIKSGELPACMIDKDRNFKQNLTTEKFYAVDGIKAPSKSWYWRHVPTAYLESAPTASNPQLGTDYYTSRDMTKEQIKEVKRLGKAYDSIVQEWDKFEKSLRPILQGCKTVEGLIHELPQVEEFAKQFFHPEKELQTSLVPVDALKNVKSVLRKAGAEND